MKASAWPISGALLLSGAVDCAAQSTPSHDGAWTVTLENDTFTSSDNNYTNGLGVTWVSNAIDTYEEQSLLRRWGKFWSFLLACLKYFLSEQHPSAGAEKRGTETINNQQLAHRNAASSCEVSHLLIVGS